MRASNIFFGMWLVLIGIVFVAAAILADHGREGWGWFLFVGALLAGGTRVRISRTSSDNLG